MIGVNFLSCNQKRQHRLATEVALQSLLASDLAAVPHQIVAVDNASTDDTVAWLSRQPGVYVIALAKNVGIAAGRNLGYRRLEDADFLVEVHNDMVFPRVWLGPLLAALDRDPTVGLASPRLMTQHGALGSRLLAIDYAWGADRIIDLVEHEAPSARRPGLVRRGLQHPVVKRAAMLREIGLYDESFLGANFEDTDEVYRARRAGWKDVVVGDAVVWHHYLFSRLDLVGGQDAAFAANRARFVAKYPDADRFLAEYNLDVERIYHP